MMSWISPRPNLVERLDSLHVVLSAHGGSPTVEGDGRARVGRLGHRAGRSHFG